MGSFCLPYSGWGLLMWHYARQHWVTRTNGSLVVFLVRRRRSCAWKALLRRFCMGALLTPEVNSFLGDCSRLQGMTLRSCLNVYHSDRHAPV